MIQQQYSNLSNTAQYSRQRRGFNTAHNTAPNTAKIQLNTAKIQQHPDRSAIQQQYSINVLFCLCAVYTPQHCTTTPHKQPKRKCGDTLGWLCCVSKHSEHALRPVCRPVGTCRHTVGHCRHLLVDCMPLIVRTTGCQMGGGVWNMSDSRWAVRSVGTRRYCWVVGMSVAVDVVGIPAIPAIPAPSRPSHLIPAHPSHPGPSQAGQK